MHPSPFSATVLSDYDSRRSVVALDALLITVQDEVAPMAAAPNVGGLLAQLQA